MDAIENAAAGEEAAVRAWIAENQALVDGWLK
jgi:ABC-type proline/glycine betaine transport system substrate-binding protein